MHFAYPPRKSSTPPKFVPRSSTRLPLLRRSRAKVIALAGLALIFLVYLLTRTGGRRHTLARHTPSGKPPVVIVTVIDESHHYPTEYLDAVRENRIQYAEKHGYETFFPKIGNYDLNGAPFSWTKVVAMRHAMTKYPDATYIWFLDQDAFIMNPSLKVEEHVMKPARLEALMIKDHPVVPPDSIIKTFTHLKGKDVDFVLTQDKDGLSVGSFLVRNGEWAEFFLETWFDPIYRSYNFQKAETHAMEHIVQWHPTILSKLSIVPQNILNSYAKSEKGAEYTPGDLVVRFAECDKRSTLACAKDSKPFEQQWRTSFKNA
ncbi:glycosyltransferase family 34 protein [Coniochaeta ligniaria NRRL 30616]|uniref:Glycosyltransferase family 34 protein n=1 Tax=Coniochaeta ligniaria NRRL 30616 TaxID=1408157 RepID=A0A1J7II57_9PEZI|nr:glycosyltransferase family 34 protein [Coniochaeta ligniaria NRRL 30616]